MAFQKGKVNLTAVPLEDRKKFFGYPAVSLVEPTDETRDKIEKASTYDEPGTTYALDEEVKDLESNFKMIESRKLDFSKPVLIIYNPNSGKRRNFREVIKADLS